MAKAQGGPQPPNLTATISIPRPHSCCNAAKAKLRQRLPDFRSNGWSGPLPDGRECNRASALPV